jgi:restriction endonuclease
MAKAKTSAKTKGDTLETAIGILETALLNEYPSYSDKTLRMEPKKIIVSDGVRHEIDLWVTVDIGNGYESTFIFEAKNWQKKIGKSHIIDFSEKIKVAPAQKGFFVAHSFTRDAIAQAKKDPRIHLLRVSESNFCDIPSFIRMQLDSIHILRIAKVKVLWNPQLKFAHDPTIDWNKPISFSIDGKTQPVWDYLNPWLSQVTGAAVDNFYSDTAPEGTYSLPFEDTRTFDSQTCQLNNEAVAKMVLSGLLEVGVTRASVVESRFDFEDRGRVYHAVSRGPFGRLETNIPVSMTLQQLLATTDNGRDWTCTNPLRLFVQPNGHTTIQVLNRQNRTAGNHGFLL